MCPNLEMPFCDMVKQFIKQTLGIFYYPFLVKRFAADLEKRNNLNFLVQDEINFVFSHYVGYKIRGLNVNIRPAQIPEEISKLLEIVDKRRPKIVCEIGTASGGTLYLFTRIAQPNAKIISIDLPGGKFGGGYPEWKSPLYKSFRRQNQKIYLIREDSHSPATVEKVKKFLSGERIDFLFIDGDHTYEGVKKDFEMYSPLVKANGIIALHDIAIHPPKTGCEVHKFWQENKNNFKYLEIISSQREDWGGIGVIYKL